MKWMTPQEDRHELGVITVYLLVGFSVISGGLWALVGLSEPVAITSLLALASGILFWHCIVQSHERLHQLAITYAKKPSQISYDHIGPFVTSGHCEIKDSIFWQLDRKKQAVFMLAPAFQWLIAIPFVLGVTVIAGLTASTVFVLLLMTIHVTGPSPSDVRKARNLIREGPPLDDLQYLGHHESAEGIA